MKLFIFIGWMIQYLLLATGQNNYQNKSGSDLVVNLNSLNIKEELGHVPEPESDNEESVHDLKRSRHGPRPLAINPGALTLLKNKNTPEMIITTSPKTLKIIKVTTNDPGSTTENPVFKDTVNITNITKIITTLSRSFNDFTTKAYPVSTTTTTTEKNETRLTSVKPSSTTMHVDKTTIDVSSSTAKSTSPPSHSNGDILINFFIKINVPLNSIRHHTEVNHSISLHGHF